MASSWTDFSQTEIVETLIRENLPEFIERHCGHGEQVLPSSWDASITREPEPPGEGEEPAEECETLLSKLWAWLSSAGRP